PPADQSSRCPTQDQIPGGVQKVSDALASLNTRVQQAKGLGNTGSGPAGPGPQILMAAVSVVEEDAKIEARIWVQGEILDNLCGD
ncbi:hypothetical protein ABTK35_20250, partial [Acinetobacter baumannii]